MQRRATSKKRAAEAEKEIEIDMEDKEADVYKRQHGKSMGDGTFRTALSGHRKCNMTLTNHRDE